MKKSIMGVEYGRGATAVVVEGGPALAPAEVHKMFPDADWTTVVADRFDAEACAKDRFGENFNIQRKIYAATPCDTHILIGGDHSVNFGHFAAIADQMLGEDVCLVYIDAHLDIHTPASSRAQASGAPHGTNVRALLGSGDERWLGLVKHRPALKKENVFYVGARSYEPAEIDFVTRNNIFMRRPRDISTLDALDEVIAEIRSRIDSRPYVVSFDFDAIAPTFFSDVLVPEAGGISVDAALRLMRAFAPDAHSVEFVEYSPTGDAQSREIVRQLVDIALNS